MVANQEHRIYEFGQSRSSPALSSCEVPKYRAFFDHFVEINFSISEVTYYSPQFENIKPIEIMSLSNDAFELSLWR